MARDFVAEAQTAVIPDIGQIDHASKLALMREVRAGRLAKWRGAWCPTAGAPWGYGPQKTCYGPIEAATYFASVPQQEAEAASFIDRVWLQHGLPRDPNAAWLRWAGTASMV